MGRASLLLLVVAAITAACGSDDEKEARSREETARQWVAANNEGDLDRACELSVVESGPKCAELLALEPFGEDLRLEGYQERGDEAEFGVSSRADRRGRRRGWTAYAPLAAFTVERDRGEYRVHLEASFLR